MRKHRKDPPPTLLGRMGGYRGRMVALAFAELLFFVPRESPWTWRGELMLRAYQLPGLVSKSFLETSVSFQLQLEPHLVHKTFPDTPATSTLLPKLPHVSFVYILSVLRWMLFLH